MLLHSENHLNINMNHEQASHPQVVSEYSVALKTKGRKTKTNKDNYIKRPLNSFMIWANEERKKIKKLNPKLCNASIAKHLGTLWHGMSENEKKVYADQAERLRLNHLLIYPNYKFNPNKRSKESKTKNTSIKAKTGEQSIKPEGGNRKIEDTRTFPSSTTNDLNEFIAQAFPYVIKFETISKKKHYNLNSPTANKNTNPEFKKPYVDSLIPPTAELQLETQPPLDTVGNRRLVPRHTTDIEVEVNKTSEYPLEMISHSSMKNLETMKNLNYREYMNVTDTSGFQDVGMCEDSSFDLSSINTDDLLQISTDSILFDDFHDIAPLSDFSLNSYLDYSCDLEMSDILNDMGVSKEWI